jgi:hypothetical protein
VTVKAQVLKFPAASVAVTVMIVVPTGNTDPEAALVVTVGAEQLSVAVGAGKFTAIDVAELFDGRLRTIFAGQVSVGAVVSFTVKLVDAVLLLPAASVAVMVIACVPNPTNVPATGVWLSVTDPGQLSEATLPETTLGIAAWQLALAEAVVAAGAVTVGGVLSVTVIVCVHDAELFEPSVTFQVMVVVPFGYGAFNAWPSLRVPLTVTTEQLSVAVGVPGSMFAEHAPGSVDLVIFAGQVIVGSSLSVTVTVCVHDDWLFASSVAVQVMVVVPAG